MTRPLTHPTPPAAAEPSGGGAGGGFRARRSAAAPVPLLALLLPLLFAAAAHAVTPATLIGPDLETRDVLLSSLRDGEVSYFDRDRRLTRDPATRLVSILIRHDDEPSRAETQANQVVATHDGQRLVGRWLGGTDGGEAVRFEHETLGPLRVTLDRLRAVGDRDALGELADPADPADANAPPPTQDVVILANGDRLTGFLTAVTPRTIELAPTGGGETIRLEPARVAALALANPGRDPAPDLHTLRLTDGSRLLGRGVVIAGDALSVLPALAGSQPVELPLADVDRLNLTGYGYRLVPVADLPRETTAGGTVFGVPTPALAIGHHLQLHAPLSLRFTLPESTERFIATARLDLAGVDPSRRPAAHCRLRVSTEPAHAPPTDWLTLTAEQPQATINLALAEASTGSPSTTHPPTHLVIELDPAANGPVLDRVTLVEPRVLTHRPTAAGLTADPDR